jgi:hypothetical protein
MAPQQGYPVPRLSIVIPALGSTDLLESGLLSVLENRPADTEVLVINGCGYQDPYELAGEVRFLVPERGCGLVESLNSALAQTAGEVVHILECGASVAPGWTDAALAHFADPQTVVVAPLVTASVLEQPRIVSAGLDYHPGGAVVCRGAGSSADSVPQASAVLGCSIRAGFLRRDAWDRVGRFDPAMGPELADVELALRLRAAGGRAVYEPASHVAVASAASDTSGLWGEFQSGRRNERLFWRGAKVTGWLRALSWHPWVAGVESLRRLGGGRMALHLAGRMWACLEWGDIVASHGRLAALASETPLATTLRLADTGACDAPESAPLRRAG